MVCKLSTEEPVSLTIIFIGVGVSVAVIAIIVVSFIIYKKNALKRS